MVHMDTVEGERLRKERDNLLWAVEELRTGIDLARQERAVAQQQTDHLEDEFQRERDLKVAVEGKFAGLATKVGQRQEEIWCVETEVTQQRNEVRKLRADVDGKSSFFLVVFLP